jgi:hypothetical protein
LASSAKGANLRMGEAGISFPRIDILGIMLFFLMFMCKDMFFDGRLQEKREEISPIISYKSYV